MHNDVKTTPYTLLFLHRDGELLLAMKKRGFGAGKLNGIGGKVEPGETIDAAMSREAQEEIGIRTLRSRKVAENDFLYKTGEDVTGRMYTYVYFCDKWEGDPVETDEMAPQWFDITNIPYNRMWPDDRHWLPEVLAGNKVVGTFTFNEHHEITSHDVTCVDRLHSE